MVKKKKMGQQMFMNEPPPPPTLNDFLIHSYCCGKQTTSNGTLKLNSCGDWSLAIHRTPVGEQYGIHSPDDFIAKFLNTDSWVLEDERQEYESMDMMELLELLNVELEELKPAKSKIKTFEGLPDKFAKCVRTRYDGNSKCFVCLAGGFVYLFDYQTS